MSKFRLFTAALVLCVAWTAWADSSTNSSQKQAPGQQPAPQLTVEEELPTFTPTNEEQTFFVPELGLEEPFESSFVGGGCPGLIPSPICNLNTSCAVTCDYLIGPCYTEACQADLCNCKAGCVECPW